MLIATSGAGPWFKARRVWERQVGVEARTEIEYYQCLERSQPAHILEPIVTQVQHLELTPAREDARQQARMSNDAGAPPGEGD